jgi:hypothetical protein
MILYHFTALAHLIGEAGLRELHKTDIGDDGFDGAAFATPDSILKAGLRPHNNGEYDLLLGEQMQPHVWLTTNPCMSNDFLSDHYLDRGKWRVAVAIPTTDRRLVFWPKFFSKRTGRDYVVSSEDRAHAYRCAREAAGFYLYFGAISLNRIRAIEHSDRAEQAGAERASAMAMAA